MAFSATTSGKTLLNILQQQNPFVTDIWKAGFEGSYTAPNRYSDTVVHIRPWKDFTYEAIQLAYGDILEQEATFREPQQPSRTPTKIGREIDLRTLGLAWTYQAVKGPLKIAAKILYTRPELRSPELRNIKPEPTIYPTRVSFEVSPGSPGSDPVTVTPQWAIFDRNIEIVYKSNGQTAPPQKKELVYVVGSNKLTQTFQSQWLGLSKGEAQHTIVRLWESNTPADERVSLSVDQLRMRVLNEVLDWCRLAQTRYAYVATQTELVALRVTAGPKDGVPSFEYAAVPWSASSGLTVNLALWALGVMAFGMDGEIRARSDTSECHFVVGGGGAK